MSHFIAALWTCDTSHDPTHCQMTLPIKERKLVEALDACNWHVISQARSLSESNEFQAIFAAPEYFFTAAAKHRLPMIEPSKVELESKLLGISKQYKKILIVPGSVYYCKPLIKRAGALKLDRQAGKLVQTTAPKNRKEKMIANLTKAGVRDLNQMGGNDIDLGRYVVFQEGAVGTGAISGRNVPSVMEKQDAISNRNALVLRNSTYLFLDGKRYGKYDKQSDFHESLMAPDQMVFVPGTKDECPEVGRHKFGVEICMDHAVGRLKKRNPTGLDFHIVVSDHVKNDRTCMAMGEFGYFLHASSNASETSVTWRDDAGGLTDLTHDKGCHFDSTPLGSGRLDFWLLPLPQDLKAAAKAAAPAKAVKIGMQRAKRADHVK